MSEPRILIVDDNPIELRFVQHHLQSQHETWSVATAENGRDAVGQLEARPADIVLTDLMMPEMDGLELLGKVREDYPETAVVIMTSQGSEEIAVQALRSGAASYITKRELKRQLSDVLEQVLDAASHNQSQSRLFSHLDASSVSFALPNDRKLIAAAIRFLQSAAQQTGILPDFEWTRLGIVLEEALSNAMIHGNLEVSSQLREREDSAYEELIELRRQEPPYCDRRIRVTARLRRDQVEFAIGDDGPGFDVDSIPDPTDPECLTRPHGRGLFMIHQLMDEVRHNAAGNEITLIKRRSQPAPIPVAEFDELVESV